MVHRAPCRVGGGIRDLDTARAWLDAGAAKIMIGTAASPEFCAALPRERVIAAVDAERGQVVVEGWRTATGTPVLERIRELAPVRSEEHTSELQSLAYLVCRLLLEKKKKSTHTSHT